MLRVVRSSSSLLCFSSIGAGCVHRNYGYKRKKKGEKGKEEQKWVEWELIKFTEEEMKKFDYKEPFGLTHVPKVIKEVGIVPEAVAGFTSVMEVDLSNKTFHTNPRFIEFLHETLNNYAHTSVKEGDVPMEADVFEGDIIVYSDDRKGFYLDNKTKLIEQILKEDILGHAAVKDGEVIPKSWHPNRDYRVFSDNYGLAYFQPWLIAKMADSIREKYAPTPETKKEEPSDSTALPEEPVISL